MLAMAGITRDYRLSPAENLVVEGPTIVYKGIINWSIKDFQQKTI